MSVRWDAVVDRSRMQAFDGSSRLPQPASHRVVESVRTGSIRAHVRLFGALAAIGAERSIQIELPAETTVGELLTRLGQRLDESFLRHVLDETGTLRRYCRLFVAGEPVEDLWTPLGNAADPAEIEIIMLTALEGG